MPFTANGKNFAILQLTINFFSEKFRVNFFYDERFQYVKLVRSTAKRRTVNPIEALLLVFDTAIWFFAWKHHCMM